MSPDLDGPSYDALVKHHKRIQGMLDDPDCTGDLLVAGLSLAWYVDFTVTESTRMRGADLRAVASRAFPPARAGMGSRDTMYDVLRKDIRRYSVYADPDSRATYAYWSLTCGAPMIRRDGLCGQHATQRELVTDHDTGRRSYSGACGRPEHRQWLAGVVARNRADAPPRPAANVGGVLERHLPEIGWREVYLYLDPKWTPPPEESPWRPPTLSLHFGDAEPNAPGSDRPALAVVTGAGERINIDGPREGRP